MDEAYYDKARNEIVRQNLVIRPLMEVNLRTGINLQENTFENMPHMATSPDVGELAGHFHDIPFILVGAGPSLDESIDFLREVQDKAILESTQLQPHHGHQVRHVKFLLVHYTNKSKIWKKYIYRYYRVRYVSNDADDTGIYW